MKVNCLRFLNLTILSFRDRKTSLKLAEMANNRCNLLSGDYENLWIFQTMFAKNM